MISLTRVLASIEVVWMIADTGFRRQRVGPLPTLLGQFVDWIPLSAKFPLVGGHSAPGADVRPSPGSGPSTGAAQFMACGIDPDVALRDSCHSPSGMGLAPRRRLVNDSWTTPTLLPSVSTLPKDPTPGGCSHEG